MSGDFYEFKIEAYKIINNLFGNFYLLHNEPFGIFTIKQEAIKRVAIHYFHPELNKRIARTLTHFKFD